MRYWLAVIIRNLASMCPHVVLTMLETLNNFLWHWSGSLIPEYLRARLVHALGPITHRLKGIYKYSDPVDARNCGFQLCEQFCALGWLMSTDSVFQRLGMRMQDPIVGFQKWVAVTPLLSQACTPRHS